MATYTIARDQEDRRARDRHASRRAHDHVHERQREEYRQGFLHVRERARRALADDGQRADVVAIAEILDELALGAVGRGFAEPAGQQCLHNEQRKH